jgi:hypothetical protein
MKRPPIQRLQKGRSMADTRAYDEPLTVEVFEGEIVLRASSGPFGVSLTASAALQTAERLGEAANAIISNQPSQMTTERD